METASPKQLLKPEKSCPLESAHTRLHQCHELWHRLVAAYPDPDEFVLVLNQLLVTLRQVTFMVQRRKAAIEDFDRWYGDWQDKMRSDPIMAWLKDARNHVEKVGDLEVASTARVEVVASWLPGPYSEFDVSPFVGPEEMISTFPADTIPLEIRKHGLLRIERRWVSKNLRHHELTDVCAHGYGVLATFLAEAHERLGFQMRTFGGETHGGRHVRVDQLGGRLPCMVITDADRTAHLNLRTGELLTLQADPISFDRQDDNEWYEQRMKDLTIGSKAVEHQEGEDALDWGSRWMSVARRTLVHDGYHLPYAFLFTDDFRPLTVVGFRFEDQAEKYMAFQRLADEVDRLGADIVIVMNEVWMAPLPDEGLTPTMERASERIDRREALAVIVATSDGRLRSYYSPFARDKDGRPVVGEVAIAETEHQWMPSLGALQSVWARWRKQGVQTGGHKGA
ncbi:MAG: hypothetical protein WB439_13735 [Acidobacteriaceae bacterium]